jgi:superfamily II DNA/RNA helicase
VINVQELRGKSRLPPKHTVLISSCSLLPKGIQIVLFSATFPEHVVKYATSFAGNANQMTLRHEDLTVEGIKQIYLDCNSDQDKYDVLVKFYGLLTIGSSIIFVKVGFFLRLLSCAQILMLDRLVKLR